MYGSITPPKWCRNVILGVLAHGLSPEIAHPPENQAWGVQKGG